jgi:hypothetical protein
MWPWNYIRLPVIRRSVQTRFWGFYPWFWACFSTVRLVFGLGAIGDRPKGWQHTSRRRRFLLTPIRRKLQIDFYVASRLRATDQRIALGRRLQRIE